MRKIVIFALALLSGIFASDVYADTTIISWGDAVWSENAQTYRLILPNIRIWIGNNLTLHWWFSPNAMDFSWWGNLWNWTFNPNNYGGANLYFSGGLYMLPAWGSYWYVSYTQDLSRIFSQNNKLYIDEEWYFCTYANYNWYSGQPIFFIYHKYSDSGDCPSSYNWYSLIPLIWDWTPRTIPTNIDGSCGTAWSSDYSYTDTAFSGSLCTTGTASPGSPTFPAPGSTVAWSCLGVGTGATVGCSAYRNGAPVVNGSCGSADIDYSYTDTAFSGSLCTTGTASPGSPTFPAPGSTVAWSCLGSGGGTTSSCIVYRGNTPVVNGSCGSSAKVYTNGSSAFYGSFCTTGTASPGSPTFPAPGSTVAWSCLGSGGGTTSSCIAEQVGATDSGVFTFPNLATITDSINGFSETITNALDFSFDYTGFELNPNDLYRYISINSDVQKRYVSTGSCESMFDDTIVYHQRIWTLPYPPYSQTSTFVNSYTSTYLDYIPVYYGSNSNMSQAINTATAEAKTKMTLYKKYLLTDNSGWNDTIIFKRKFNYVDGGTRDLITLNTGFFDSIKLFPFKIVIFGKDISESINNGIKKIFQILNSILQIPVSAINLITEFWGYTNLDTSQPWFCYMGIWAKQVGNLATGTAIDGVLDTMQTMDSAIVRPSKTNGSTILYYLLFIALSMVSFKRTLKIL